MLPVTQARRLRSSNRRLKLAPTHPITTTIVWQKPITWGSADHCGQPSGERCLLRPCRWAACQEQGPEQWQPGVQPTAVEPQTNSCWQGQCQRRKAEPRQQQPLVQQGGASGSQPSRWCRWCMQTPPASTRIRPRSPSGSCMFRCRSAAGGRSRGCTERLGQAWVQVMQSRSCGCRSGGRDGCPEDSLRWLAPRHRQVLLETGVTAATAAAGAGFGAGSRIESSEQSIHPPTGRVTAPEAFSNTVEPITAPAVISSRRPYRRCSPGSRPLPTGELRQNRQQQEPPAVHVPMASSSCAMG